MKINIPQSAFIPKFLPFIEQANNRFQVIYGGAGSGKSYSIAQKLLIYILTQNNCKILCIRKVARTLRHSMFAIFKHIIGEWQLTEYFKINKSDMVISCVLNDSVLIFQGLDDVEKIKSIHGINHIWIEEASEISEDDLKQLNLRLRGKTKIRRQIILSFNPISELHWLKSYFFDNKVPDLYVLHSTYKDNQFLDEEYKAEIEHLCNIDENFYRIYALGEWGVLEGLIYKAWNICDRPERWDEIGYGLDFGYSSNQAALVRIYSVGEREKYIEELIYETGLTNQDLVERFQKIGVNKRDVIIADSAEPKSIAEIKKFGYNIHPCKKGPDSILYGINQVKAQNMHIIYGSQNVINENITYSWKKDKDGKYLPVPVKFKDHLVDAIRYYIMSQKYKLKAGRIGAGNLGF